MAYKLYDIIIYVLQILLFSLMVMVQVPMHRLQQVDKNKEDERVGEVFVLRYLLA